MVTRELLTSFLILTLLLQIGCSNISQILLPIESNRNEQEVRSLNYFGGKLSSTICLVDSVEFEARWLNLRDDKIYFLTKGCERYNFTRNSQN